MDIEHLIASLSDPLAYPFPVAAVEVHQTHISAVFLAGPFAYKLKKPVEMGFLDFRDPDRRHHFCQEEVRINRRLAPSVYLGVLPVTRQGNHIAINGPGKVIDWVVQMQRLPAEASLLAHLERGDVSVSQIKELARRIARFHAEADRGEHISALGRFEIVASNARENFEQARPCIGKTIQPAVFERLQTRTERALALLRPLIEERARRGVPCETHGDLHTDHVYLFPNRPPPDDLIVIDGIEFNERFRYADPVADVAFLVMDLKFRGREDLARVFADTWFAASGDDAGLPLLPFYTAYRAMVRGKVEGFALTEEEIPSDERAADCVLARAHWLLALQELETSARRPCLVLVGGLPGSGKSTLARGLAEHAGFEVIRTDIVRKQWTIPGELLYTPVWTDRTYDECLRRAERLLLEGQRVVVVATFVEDVWRRAFLDLARRLSIPAILFICRVAPETARVRLTQRSGDASDAGWAVYEKLTRRWQKPGSQTRPFVREISSAGTPAEVLAQASAELSRLGVWEG